MSHHEVQGSESERRLLGSMLLDPSIIGEVRELVEVGDFACPIRRSILKTVLKSHTEGVAPDVVSVMMALLKMGMDESTVTATMEGLVVATARSWRPLVRHVTNSSQLRRVIEHGRRVIAMAEGADPLDAALVIERARDSLNAATGATRQGVVAMSHGEAMDAALNAIRTAAESGKAPGITTGIDALDGLSRWEPEKLYIVGGATSHGKSAFCVFSSLAGAIESGTRALYFSTEVSAPDLAMRTMSARCDINGAEMRRGIVPDGGVQRLVSEQSKNRDAVSWVFAPGRMTTGLIADRVRMEIERRDVAPLGSIWVDYGQQITPMERTKSREQDVARIADELLEIAGKFKLPVIVAAQVSRKNEGRTGDARRPRTDDLRESAQLGMNATGVVFMHRWDMLDKEDHRPSELVVTKNRNGQLGIVPVDFNKTTGAFKDVRDSGGWS